MDGGIQSTGRYGPDWIWILELFATMNCVTIVRAEEIKSEFAKIAEWRDRFITAPDGSDENPAFDLPRGFEPC